MSKAALFLDRDGVINEDANYVYRPDQVVFLDGIFDLVRTANLRDMPVIVVTNQAGIARGFYTEDDFHALMDWICGHFLAHGARLDAVYFSPFHAEHGTGVYRRDSDCRKPKPGLLLQAAREWAIHLPHSVIVGDKPSDMAAGAAAGVTHRWLLSPETAPLDEIDYVQVRSLTEAAERLKLLATTRSPIGTRTPSEDS
jgi:D-glycero-D-manno-heptose 1,7-bisphosphate phosphatase